MTTPKINLLNHQPIKGGAKKMPFFKLFFYPLIFIVLFICIFSVEVILSGDSIIDNLQKINIFQNINFSLSNDKLLAGESDDRINILLMGMGGVGHPGPYLTDTMILVSLKPSQNKISMMSIPRDLSVPIPGYGWRKINEANSYGEVKNGEGAKFASETVAKVFNQPIHYYVRVDFSGFEKLIDELGGIKIEVDNDFVDTQFPTSDLGYQTVAFKKGLQNMDGQTALNYARSRHGTNGESSDFARSKRQQKVLTAIKDKSFSFTTFMSFRKITAIFNMYKDNISTNLQPWEVYKFYKLAKNFNNKDISNLVINDAPGGLLFASNINGAYLLLPKDMSFKQLQNTAQNVFGTPLATEKEPEIIKVEIQNGTKIEGLAYRTSVKLKNQGYQITKIANADKQDYIKTLIYDLTNGQKQDMLNNLQSNLQADILTQKPVWLETANEQADFIIILGKDQEALTRAN
jgi:polyisoprenyl-teichoic acid--peptidoglycan teichoic acid transferase